VLSTGTLLARMTRILNGESVAGRPTNLDHPLQPIRHTCRTMWLSVKRVVKEEVCSMAVTTRRGLSGVKIFRLAFITLTLLTASIYPVSAQNLSTASIDGLVTDQ